jgi:hypothetical protein
MLADARIFMSSVLRIREAVRDVHRAALDRRAANDRTAIHADRMFRKVFDVVRLSVVGTGQMARAILQLEKAGIL